jgi:hypothetical protein
MHAGIGGYLSHNITAYYDISVQLAYNLTGPGSAADRLIHKNVGRKVGDHMLVCRQHFICMHDDNVRHVMT